MEEDRLPCEEWRKQEKASYEEGRKRFDEGLARFDKRYAWLGAALLLFATVLFETTDFWVPPLLYRSSDRLGDSVLQALGTPSASGFEFTNRDSSEVSNCAATIRDSMGIEWQAPITGPVASDQAINLAWSDFVHQGKSIDAEAARTRRVVVSCFVGRLHARRAAVFER